VITFEGNYSSTIFVSHDQLQTSFDQYDLQTLLEKYDLQCDSTLKVYSGAFYSDFLLIHSNKGIFHITFDANNNVKLNRILKNCTLSVEYPISGLNSLVQKCTRTITFSSTEIHVMIDDTPLFYRLVDANSFSMAQALNWTDAEIIAVTSCPILCHKEYILARYSGKYYMVVFEQQRFLKDVLLGTFSVIFEFPSFVPAVNNGFERIFSGVDTSGGIPVSLKNAKFTKTNSYEGLIYGSVLLYSPDAYQSMFVLRAQNYSSIHDVITDSFGNFFTEDETGQLYMRRLGFYNSSKIARVTESLPQKYSFHILDYVSNFKNVIFENVNGTLQSSFRLVSINLDLMEYEYNEGVS
jgi:hypothetical protein